MKFLKFTENDGSGCTSQFIFFFIFFFKIAVHGLKICFGGYNYYKRYHHTTGWYP